MQRILVVGVSAGTGKSTFARALGEKLSFSVTYLDGLYFEAGWKEVSSEVFQQRQADVISNSTWIIEGNYSNTLSVRDERADTIIYLELPLSLCLYRVLKRRVRFHRQTRPELGEGCPERLNFEFLKYIVITYKKRKLSMSNKMQQYQDSGKKVFLLQSRQQIDGFLKNL